MSAPFSLATRKLALMASVCGATFPEASVP